MRCRTVWRLLSLMLIGGSLWAMPFATAAQDATPAATPAPAGPNATLLSLLGVAPDFPNGQQPKGEIAEFADVAAQLDAVRVAPITSLDDPGARDWISATIMLAMPQDPTIHAADPLWRQTFGFDIFQIDQSLVVGEPPNQITIMRGRFDQSEVSSALEQAGYKKVDIGGIQGYSLYEEPKIDLDSPVSQLALGKMNNAVFLPDGTLVFAGYLDTIRRVVAVSNGEKPSLADRIDISTLVPAMPRQLASAILAPGAALSLSGALFDPRLSPEQIKQLDEQIQQTGKMPPIALALLGVTPGGPLLSLTPGATPVASPAAGTGENAVFDIGLLTLSPEQARTAEQTVVTRVQTLTSMVTQEPYTHWFANAQAAGPSDQPVAVVELSFADNTSTRIWAQLLQRRDLLFLGW
jgi:hypothetical protein